MRARRTVFYAVKIRNFVLPVSAAFQKIPAGNPHCICRIKIVTDSSFPNSISKWSSVLNSKGIHRNMGRLVRKELFKTVKKAAFGLSRKRAYYVCGKNAFPYAADAFKRGVNCLKRTATFYGRKNGLFHCLNSYRNPVYAAFRKAFQKRRRNVIRIKFNGTFRRRSAKRTNEVKKPP